MHCSGHSIPERLLKIHGRWKLSPTPLRICMFKKAQVPRIIILSSLHIYFYSLLLKKFRFIVVFCIPFCISNSIYDVINCWIRLRILPYFSFALSVLREFKGKIIYVRLSEAN